MNVLSRLLSLRRFAPVAAAAALGSLARAQLLDPLLPAGSFTLSPAFNLFPSVDSYGTPGNPSDDIGPLGITFLAGPFRVMVTTHNGEIRIFGADTPLAGPAQPAPAAVVSHGPGNACGLAQIGGVVYLTQQSGTVVTVSSALGSEGTVLSTVASVPGATGITPFPPSASVLGAPSHAGHLFVSGAGGIYEVDPAIGGGYAPPVYIPVSVDGMQVTPSGNYLMASVFVLPVTGGTGVMVWDISVTPPVLAYVVSVPVTASPLPYCDGLAIGTGTLAGKAYANCTNGEVWEVVYDVLPFSGPELDPPPFPGTTTRIVYAGSRGDFVAVDANVACLAGLPGATPYASLLFTQSTSIWRLDPPGGGWFGNPTSDQYVLTTPFESYCTAGTSGIGCVATMGAIGSPSASATSGFTLTCSDVEAQRPGLVFYGMAGAAVFPWGGSSSYLCVKAPTQRTPTQNSGGSIGTCAGSYAIDWRAFLNASPGALGNPLMAGTDFYGQTWYRDPASPKTTSFSDALRWTVQP